MRPILSLVEPETDEEISGASSLDKLLKNTPVFMKVDVEPPLNHQTIAFSEIDDPNRRKQMVEADKEITDLVRMNADSIISEFPSFLDQIQVLHYIGMVGKEDVMLFPSQKRRLKAEGVSSIAGRLRPIQAGFGDFIFNGPTVEHLGFLMKAYAKKVEGMLATARPEQVYNLASFAQYYFCILHPFYERIGRTSEDLIFLLFQQGPAVEPRYISQTGWRESPLAKERQEMINSTAYQLNKKIASFLGVGSEGVERTPDIYREITRKYFPSEFERIYSEKRDRPFYYEHPIGVVLKLYYLAMESIVYNEMISFDLDNPHQHIVKLGEHLRDKGFNKYIFQKQNRGNQQENLSVEQIIGATLSLSNTQPQH